MIEMKRVREVLRLQHAFWGRFYLSFHKCIDRVCYLMRTVWKSLWVFGIALQRKEQKFDPLNIAV